MNKPITLEESDYSFCFKDCVSVIRLTKKITLN